MKTKTLITNFVKTFTSQNTFCLLLAILFAFAAGIAHGQKLSIGASLSGMVSGSGLGSSLSPQLSVNTERQNFSAGINIQDRHSNLSGVRGRYSFILNPDEATEIFLFYDMAYHTDALLGNYTARKESFINPEFSGYYTNARMKTIEQHVGLGLNVLVFGSFKVFGAAGVGFYNTRGIENKFFFQYRELNNCSVMLMAGIKMDLKRIR